METALKQHSAETSSGQSLQMVATSRRLNGEQPNDHAQTYHDF